MRYLLMRGRLLIYLSVLTMAYGLLQPPLDASAQQALWEVGTLTCTLARESQGRSASTAGQSREAVCQFRPGNSGPEETYVGTLQFIGRDANEGSAASTLMLIVKAPVATKLAPGVLQQTYAADASTVADKQIPLIGRSNGSIVLHPEHERTVEPSLALGQSKATTVITAEFMLKASPA